MQTDSFVELMFLCIWEEHLRFSPLQFWNLWFYPTLFLSVEQAVSFEAVTLYYSLNSVTGSQTVKGELGQK